MTPTKVKVNQFVGNSNTYGDANTPGSLAKIVTGLVQDLAKQRILLAGALTDNSTGVAVYPRVATAQAGATIAPFTDAGSDTSAPKAGFDTITAEIAAAMAVLARQFNQYGAPIGLPEIIDHTTGVVVTAGTIPAITQTMSETGGTTACVDVVTGQAVLGVIRQNMDNLIGCMNRFAYATGYPELITGIAGAGFQGGGVLNPVTLAAIGSTGTGVPGTAANSTILNATAQTELAAIAANIATIAAVWNDMVEAQPSALSGTPGGTGSTTTLLAHSSLPTAAGAASTSASSSATITAFSDIAQDFCDLAAQINTLLRQQNLPELTDSTGKTASGTLTAIPQTVAAVDGTQTSPYLGVAFASLSSPYTQINNNMSSLTAQVNTLANVYGLQPLTDAVGGTVSSTISAVTPPTLQTGVNVATVLATSVNTWLVEVSSNVTSLKLLLNEMVGTTTITAAPLHNVAWNV